MMHKYTVLLLLSVLSLMGQAQSLSFQELLNKKEVHRSDRPGR